MKIVEDTNRWEGKIVTTLEPWTKFWPAEPEHQDYLVKKPNGYTCHFEKIWYLSIACALLKVKPSKLQN